MFTAGLKDASTCIVIAMSRYYSSAAAPQPPPPTTNQWPERFICARIDICTYGAIPTCWLYYCWWYYGEMPMRSYIGTHISVKFMDSRCRFYTQKQRYTHWPSIIIPNICCGRVCRRRRAYYNLLCFYFGFVLQIYHIIQSGQWNKIEETCSLRNLFILANENDTYTGSYGWDNILNK